MLMTFLLVQCILEINRCLLVFVAVKNLLVSKLNFVAINVEKKPQVNVGDKKTTKKDEKESLKIELF